MQNTRRTGPTAVVGLLAVVTCSSPRDAQVDQLQMRVDSLAITVQAIASSLRASTGRKAPETLRVSAKGVAALGEPSAPVTIVEFSDYQCPFCARHALTTFARLRSEFINHGIVRYIIRDLPLSIHSHAVTLALAARCVAADQPTRYWQFRDSLFTMQRSLAVDSLPRLASAIGVPPENLTRCLEQNRFSRDIARDAEEAQRAGLNATPTFVIGHRIAGDSVEGVVIDGAYPFSDFASAIQHALGKR